MFNYNQYRHETLAALFHIGQKCSPNEEEAGMTHEQAKRRRARNFITDEMWQYRRLAGGSLIAEISYGWMMDKPLLGLTVFCIGELAREAKDWDHSLSGCFHDIESLADRCRELDEGGLERIKALAEAA